MDWDKLKRVLGHEKAQEGLILGAAGGGLLLYSLIYHYSGGFGGWPGSPYLFPAGAAALLLALALRLLWAGLKSDPLDEDYIYPDEVYLDSSTLDGVDVGDLFVDAPPEAAPGEPVSPQAAPAPARRGWLLWAVLGLTAGYCLVMTVLGFLLSTFLYLAVLLVLAGERRGAVVGLVSAITSAAVYLVFSVLLGVLLP